jgi:hypothetical protein
MLNNLKAMKEKYVELVDEVIETIIESIIYLEENNEWEMVMDKNHLDATTFFGDYSYEDVNMEDIENSLDGLIDERIDEEKTVGEVLKECFDIVTSENSFDLYLKHI